MLGRLGEGAFALLCLDTDKRGVEGFIRKIQARAAGLSFEPMSATYPDHLFHTLGQGLPPAFKPLLLAEGPAAAATASSAASTSSARWRR